MVEVAGGRRHWEGSRPGCGCMSGWGGGVLQEEEVELGLLCGSTHTHGHWLAQRGRWHLHQSGFAERVSSKPGE